MRKDIQIVGFGSRRTGTNKKGEPFDFIPVSITFEDARYSGLRAETVNVDGGEYDRCKPVIGEVYDAIMHEHNFKVYLDAIL